MKRPHAIMAKAFATTVRLVALAVALCLCANAATELTLNDGDTLTGVYEDYEITIAAGATVTFNNATVTRTNDNAAVVKTLGDATIILAPGSVNSVTHTKTDGYAGAGISPAVNYTLTIDGSGSLTVQGGCGSAGIGANSNYGSCGNIVIAGGTIVATGGEGGSGIGAGYYDCKCGDITISGGNVTASVLKSTGSYYPSAIGAGFIYGRCGDILICGGTITADASDPDDSYDNACAIGASNGTCGSITIVDGVERLVATKGTKALEIIGKGDSGATVGKVSRFLRFNEEYSNDGKTLTLTPGSDFPTYTVTWTNIDGAGAIDTTTVEYGLMPEHAAATKASDADFDNAFAGWVPELAEVESNTTYTAAFYPVPRARSTGGNAEWVFDTDGSLRSGAIDDNGSTWFRVSLPRPCVFTFEWKTSSEGNYDKLGFKVNGEDAYDTARNKIEPISGVKDNWATVSVVVSNSLDVLEWKYWKDNSGAGGLDCGWIRNFSMAPYEGEVRTLSVVPNYDGEATVNAYASKDCVLGVFPVVARHGYAFLGLFTAAEGGELVEPPYALSADTTLYAHWAKTTDFDTSDPGAPWTIENDGITWRTGAIGHSTNTWATYTVKRPCTVTYKWKTSTEVNNDPLVFYVDDVEQGRISGEMTDWADISLTFEDSANHVLKWVYYKDYSSTGTYDCGWIRDFVVTPLDSWAVTRDLNYEGAGELETRYVKKGNQLDVSEFPPLDEPREGYTCYWALAPWSGDALTNAVDISADTTLYAHWVKQYGFNEFDTTCQTPWTWLDDGSIRTGKIGNSTNTWATISVTGPCDVTFKWKASTESGWDPLVFYVDGAEQSRISGETEDWVSCSISVDSGDHVLKWAYYKDGGNVGRYDCGWIKDIVITTPDSAPYTVTWQNADGTVLETDADLAAGAVPAYNSALPTLAATAQYTYEFAGWEQDFELVSSNTVYTAKYTPTLRSYDVTWLDEDGTQLATETLFYGETPACEAPTKEATAQYTYTFAGWTPEVTTVTGDATYTATYNATINKYTVTWKDDDGTTLGTDTVAYGSTPSRADPSKAATAQYTYTFTGWSPAVAEVTGDATYTATYSETVNTYTITWLDYDGATLKTETLAYGATPTCATPSRADDTYSTYTFLEWMPAVASVTGEATYTATYMMHSKWTGQGTVYEPYTLTTPARIAEILALDEGSTPEIFVQTGGDVTAESISAQLPTGYAVRTTETPGIVKVVQTVTVVWYDEDGETVLERDDDVDIGSMPSFDGAMPTKAATKQYTYEFNGWTPIVVAVTGSASYTATYTETLRSYTITWLDADGSQIGTSTVAYGGTPTHAAPASAYTFTGWSPAIATVTGDATYTATFNHEVQLANLTGDYMAKDGDVLTGTTSHNVTIPGGVTVTFNGVSVAGAGGGADPVTPEFNAGGEAVTTKFEKGEGDTWKITAWGEIGNDASGTGVADGQINVYRGDDVDDVTTPVTPTITKKKSAVKVEMTVEAPSGKDSQFFRVDFGE